MKKLTKTQQTLIDIYNGVKFSKRDYVLANLSRADFILIERNKKTHRVENVKLTYMGEWNAELLILKRSKKVL